MCETKIKIAYMKKNVYKEIKETTHVEIGEEDIHHIYISKIRTMYVKMVTRPMYKKLKEALITTKEVNTLPNKMKHNSSLQRHVFHPLTCRILKRNYIFSSFFSWLTKGTRSYKTSPEKQKMIKDDQRDTRNPYKSMNVMK